MEPACAVLEIPPSTYYAAKKREENPSARDRRDVELKKEITRVRERKGRRNVQHSDPNSIPAAGNPNNAH